MKQQLPSLASLLLLLVIGAMENGCKSRSAADQQKLDIKLCQASLKGDLVHIKYLLPLGANPNTTQCGEYAKVGYHTPLFFALLGVERDVNDLLRREDSPKYHSDDKQRLTVMALLAAGANPNTKSPSKIQETPLMYAEFLRATEIAKVLVDGGADQNISDANGKLAKDYSQLNYEDIKVKAGIHGALRLVIVLADKDVAEKELIDEIVPKK